MTPVNRGGLIRAVRRPAFALLAALCFAFAAIVGIRGGVDARAPLSRR